MHQGIVFKIKKFALHDGPGIRTTIFLKGCPLHCWWCHNPEGISPAPQVMNGRRRAVVGEPMSVDKVMTEIRKDKLFYDESGGGVTFSGGEPTMQPRFLEELLTACRQEGVHTAVDTSGYAPAETFLRLTGLADLILFDLKLMDPVRHKACTGVDNGLILENFKSLCRQHPAVQVRIPLIPGVSDGEATIRAVADRIKTCGKPLTVDLLPFHRIGNQKYEQLGMEYKLAGLASPSARELAETRSLFEQHGVTVTLGG